MKPYSCIKCNDKTTKNFYPACKNLCKVCYRKRASKNRNKKLKYYQEYDRKRASLPHRVKLRKIVAERWKGDTKLREKSNQQKKNWILKNKQKRRAHLILARAVKGGLVFKFPCRVCGDCKSDGHHEDYKKPLDVIWLCKKHHGEHHKRLREHHRLLTNR